MPCALLVSGNTPFWNDNLKTIYDMLHKDILINVRTSMAAGFKEIIKLVNIEKMDKESDKQYFINILNQYLKDSDESICQKVLPTICNLVSKFPDDKKLELLDSLIKSKIE